MGRSGFVRPQSVARAFPTAARGDSGGPAAAAATSVPDGVIATTLRRRMVACYQFRQLNNCARGNLRSNVSWHCNGYRGVKVSR